MMVKDSMVLLHLAEITLLEKSCEYFRDIIIPSMIYNEVLVGKEKGYLNAKIVIDFIEKKKIAVKQVRSGTLLKKAEEFNIQKGEAEAVALYWQEKADYLATDEDNVRKKSVLLNVNVIGTPAIVLKLYKKNLIERKKFEESLSELRKIGWFSDVVIDKVKMEGLK